jgi:hypothetical protein
MTASYNGSQLYLGSEDASGGINDTTTSKYLSDPPLYSDVMPEELREYWNGSLTSLIGQQKCMWREQRYLQIESISHL